jgi:hypothetical protein
VNWFCALIKKNMETSQSSWTLFGFSNEKRHNNNMTQCENRASIVKKSNRERWGPIIL